MKRILFMALNSSWSQSNLALYYLREVIRDLDYETVMAAFTLKEPLHQIMEEVYHLQPDIICFSAYIWNRACLQELQVELAKIMPQTRFVVGGPESGAFLPDHRVYVISGPGERSFYELAKSGFTSVPKPGANFPLSEIPFPYRQEDEVDLAGHLIYYECFRGCPYGCIYCLSARDCRREARFDLSQEEDFKRLYSELRVLASLKPRTLKFIDRSFNTQKQLAKEIWRFAIENDLDFDLHFEIYPDLIEDKDIELLSKAPAGRIRFEVGIQSTNDEVLERCGRVSSWQKSRKVLIALKQRTEIRLHTDLLVGLPGEDFASVIRSLNELCACEPAAVTIGHPEDSARHPHAGYCNQARISVDEQPAISSIADGCLELCRAVFAPRLCALAEFIWNKEEYPDTWHSLLQLYPADRILDALLSIHRRDSIPLHSVSRQKRAMIMTELCSTLELPQKRIL
jgi:radical SAM superfamily enzyme YgiQ (UPF0313 family)